MLLLDDLPDFFMCHWLVDFMNYIDMLFINHRLIHLVYNFLVDDRLNIFVNNWLNMLVNNVLMMFMNHRLMSLIDHFLMVFLDKRWKNPCVYNWLFLMTLNN